MRKRVSQNSGDFWTQLPQNEREQIKAKLPELILAEPKLVLRVFAFLSHSRPQRVYNPATSSAIQLPV